MALVAGRRIAIGNRALLAEHDVARALDVEARRLEEQGRTVMWVAELEPTRALRGLIAVMDQVKPSAAAAVRRLQAAGIATVLLTGDNARTAQAVADALGIERVLAEVLPEGKAAEIERLQDEPATASPWLATASTTHPRWRWPMSASPWEPAPPWRCRRPGSR